MRIKDPERIEILASPVRQELVDTLGLFGQAATVAELAEQLGRPADGLYYHLRLLVQAGIVHEDREGEGGERRYRLEGDGRPMLEYRNDDPRNLAAVGRVAQGLVQIGLRDFESALKAPETVVEGPLRQLWAARNKGWVGESELREINQLLDRLCSLISKPRAVDRDMLMSLAFVLAPLAARPKRRDRSAGAAASDDPATGNPGV